MKAYLDLLRDVMENGVDKEDRTGTGTRSVFGRQLRFDLDRARAPSEGGGFPLLTTKKVHTKSILHELLWFVAGDTNNNTLRERGVTVSCDTLWRFLRGAGISFKKNRVRQRARSS